MFVDCCPTLNQGVLIDANLFRNHFTTFIRALVGGVGGLLCAEYLVHDLSVTSF